MSARARSFPVSALAACVLGLVVCPWVFIATGALSKFNPMFSVVMLPPFLLGGGFLLWRFLSRPPDPPVRRIPLLLIEGASWMAVGTFLFFVSGINLMTAFERVGAVCTAFLVASALCLPFVLRRGTALETRLRRLPRAVIITLLLTVLAASSGVAVCYLRTPPAFI